LGHHGFQAELINGRKLKSSQPSGLALIESLYFRAGPETARDQFQRLLGPDQSVRPFALCDAGHPSVGMDIVPEDDITYDSFSPPPSWNAAYSLQQIQLGPKHKSEFVFHPGEEIMIPIHGEVSYHFFWSPGARPPERVVLNSLVGEGSFVRINPQIPHHAWGTKSGATAWLFLRHATNSPVALVMDHDSSSLVLRRSGNTAPVKNQESSLALRTPLRRRVTETDLRKPGAYAMIAWGISELIRDARQKTGLTTTDLARQIGIDPSSMSRLEEAKANVSIDMLGKVCRALRIGMGERMESGSWIYECYTIEDSILERGRSSNSPCAAHFLHPKAMRISRGEHRKTTTGRGNEVGQLSSWIVLSGRLLVELPQSMGTKSVILDTGNVLHFREHGELTFEALQDSTVVQVVYSQNCECEQASAKTTV
jgi:transcriptional regulator with XRE-family HTH domain